MKDKMSIRDDSGFEALFMPLQEILSKVWEITLTKCLEKYLNHLKLIDDPSSTNFINFTEAAVLVQNSATFYGKRVDSVYLGCRKFVERLQQTDKGEEVDENGIPNKKRRVQKNLLNDNADVLDFICSENNIEMKLCDYDKTVDKKRLILNKNLKSFLKNSTSISVYQTKEVEMGTKDEFKLNWPLSISGILNEDFVINKEGINLVWGVDIGDLINDNSFDVLMDNDLDVSNTSHLEVPPISDCNPEFASSPLPPSPLPISSPEPVTLKEPEAPVKNIPFLKNLKFDFFIPLILAKKKKTFVLPVDIIHEVENWRSSRRKRKLSSQDENSSLCNEKCKEFFNFLKHYELQDPRVPQFKINLANNERRKELLLRRKENAKIVRRAAEEFHDDFPGFDDVHDENDDDDNHDQGGVTEPGDFPTEVDVGFIRPININSQEEAKSTYEQDAILTMREYQRNKRQHANELTEVAKRVAAWHDSMHDMLEAAETRSKFDIHKYGSNILDSFPEECVSSRISFHQLVKDQPKPEISRFLLSTLMLANTYNVELVLTKSGHLVKDCLELKLLSKVRHHEEMDEHLKATTSHEPIYQ